jgi:hypothetical protein
VSAPGGPKGASAIKLYLKSAAHLDTAPDAMDLGFESLNFAQQLGDRPNEALIDIDLRMLVLRVLKESLGGRNGHGDNASMRVDGNQHAWKR